MECNALKESLKIIREDITEKYNQTVKEELNKKDQTIQKLQQENQQLKNQLQIKNQHKQ